MPIDDKDLAIAGIVLLGVVAMIVAAFNVDVTGIVTHAFTALGSLAVGRQLNDGKK